MLTLTAKQHAIVSIATVRHPYVFHYAKSVPYYFLKAVQGAANVDRNGELTLGELRNYLNEEVPYMARRLRNRIQTPEVNGKDGKIIVQY